MLNLSNLWARTVFAVSLACLSVTTPAVAQDYPNRPVRLVVPFPAGGTTDAAARMMAQELSNSLGQTVVVDNKPGANGTIAASEVARAPADGHTLLFTTAAIMAVNPALYKLPFDPLVDFTPIASVVSVPVVLLANPALGATNLMQLIELAKSRPGKIAFGSSGSGGISHLASEMLKQRSQIDMLHVPYKGGAPALQDLVGNQVQIMFDGVASSLQLVRSGKLVVLAVPASRRLAAMPEVPTFEEAGMKDFQIAAWFGVVGPKALSPAITTKLHNEVNKILGRADVKQRISELGLEALPMNEPEFTAFIRAEHARYAKVVAAGKIKVD